MLHRFNREMVNTAAHTLDARPQPDQLPHGLFRVPPKVTHNQYCTSHQYAEHVYWVGGGRRQISVRVTGA
jgi:hypothetical protein